MRKFLISLLMTLSTLFAESYTYCGNGFSLTIESICLDALLAESQGKISFKERKYICESVQMKLPQKQYKEITDILLRPSLARELQPCYREKEVSK